MSILVKPYEISIWEDVWDDSREELVEKWIGNIGSNLSKTQNSLIEPILTRNVNGTKKLSFKMYKRYIDTITGEETENPFTKWLTNERKVKLKYEEEPGQVSWYDFVIKNVVENSSNYLYTYELEDVLVQELSKNGFNITLDAELRNNIGDANKLGADVLAETDWNIDEESEVFVEKIDEALVYLTMPIDMTGLQVYHLKDQVAPYTQGVTEELIDGNQLSGKTILAFYSSCKNKLHRFQFIYANQGDYGKLSSTKYKIQRKDDRTISESDCQYYIDFSSPKEDYEEPDSGVGTNNAKPYELYLPKGFSIATPASYNDGIATVSDGVISGWYRGKRYGFAQQAEYIPLLERYCQKFKRNEQIVLNSRNTTICTTSEGEGFSGSLSSNNNGDIIGANECTKNSPWTGIRFDLDIHEKDHYLVEYTLEITGGKLERIGGHNHHFQAIKYWIGKDDTELKPIEPESDDSYIVIEEATSGSFNIKIEYKKRKEPTSSNSGLYIQPNRGLNTSVTFNITNLKITRTGDYFGYTDSEFVSPTLVQNYINNYLFESTSGWTATSTISENSQSKPKVENVYGRFVGGSFKNITQDFYDGTYSEDNEYNPYMKMYFTTDNQYVLNSGVKDNRSVIGYMNEGEEWVLDYKIVNDSNDNANDAFEFSLKEYIYNTFDGIYNERNSYISFSVLEPQGADISNIPAGCSRKIIKVITNNYTKDAFKKESKIYLKIKPNTSGTYYIEKIALYKKALDVDAEIIIPDYENETSLSAEEYVSSSTLNKEYHYFSSWLLDPDNPNAITDKEQLPTIMKKELNYVDYLPVYNEGAKKIRTVSAKESNYFNILQSIAETFEAWLLIKVTRNENTGAIESKTIQFKNYSGENNYASFRYGVNLKDIQRTFDSKQIVTKLIVKQNVNELAEDGFCTIQRAGANPTGENYIYDFQYYQNMGIMDPKEYLDCVYTLDGAVGPDGELWPEGGVDKTDNTFTLNGYYPRIKKINDAIVPINKEIVGLSADLVNKKAQLEVAKATYEASVTGIEQTREDFLALTGVYPEETQTENIVSITRQQGDNAKDLVVPQEDWWVVDGEPNLSSANKTVSINIKTSAYDKECYAELVTNSAEKAIKLTGDAIELTKSGPYTGIYLKEEWEHGRTYTLTYNLKVTSDNVPTIIGGHCANFDSCSFYINDEKQEFTLVSGNGSNDTSRVKYTFVKNSEYTIKLIGTYNAENYSDATYPGAHDLWIQPNRGVENGEEEVVCEISNIKLTKLITEKEATKDYDRTAHFYLNIDVGVEDYASPVPRTYSLSCIIPGGQTSAQITQEISVVDKERSDVQKYITEYVTYYEKLKSSGDEKTKVEPEVISLEQAIKEKEEYRKKLLQYKAELNKKFFSKYSRFIQEGTWTSEEYVDDEKYYADAQSVLYNSCYPQVSYSINVIALQSLPDYELFTFGLGDKTYVIDEQFFGTDLQEEVVITEITESLDNPSANTIKVQNFKNQFQDLFQKITATVQQTQYNVGSYEKGAALLEASVSAQNEFITNAINSAEQFLAPGKQHTVKIGTDGITITDNTVPTNQLRLVGGAILLSAEDPETKEMSWITGVTNKGISANLITAGRLDAGVVQIMNGDEPTFRWDSYGISAYDATWGDQGVTSISGINSNKFVRFDKHGIYGIDNYPGIAGNSWHPTNKSGETAQEEIDRCATFSLTWEGLKITGENGAIARIGNYSWIDKDGEEQNAIMKVFDGEKDTFAIDPSGHVTLSGNLTAETGSIGNWTIIKGNLVSQLDNTIGIELNGVDIGHHAYKNAFHIFSPKRSTITEYFSIQFIDDGPNVVRKVTYELPYWNGTDIEVKPVDSASERDSWSIDKENKTITFFAGVIGGMAEVHKFEVIYQSDITKTFSINYSGELDCQKINLDLLQIEKESISSSRICQTEENSIIQSLALSNKDGQPPKLELTRGRNSLAVDATKIWIKSEEDVKDEEGDKTETVVKEIEFTNEAIVYKGRKILYADLLYTIDYIYHFCRDVEIGEKLAPTMYYKNDSDEVDFWIDIKGAAGDYKYE